MNPADPSGPRGLSAEAMEKLAKEIRELESEGYEVDNWVLHPGEAFRTQVSNEDKILAVLKGTVRIETPLESRELTPGDVYSIPHGLVHSVTPEEGGDVYILVAHREPPPIPPEAFRNRSAD
jgi:quercetin dioxygenase-like cupin family protein